MFASGSRRPTLLVTVCVLVAVIGAAVAGCDQLPGGDDTNAKPKTWDLLEPPTREDVGMEGEESIVVHDSDEPTPVTFLLPEKTSLDVHLVRLQFDNLGAVPARGSDPTGFDARTDSKTLAKLVPTYRSALEQLGMRTGRVRKFEYHAGSASGGKEVRSRSSSRMYGYLRLTVEAHFDASKQRGYLTMVGTWGRGRS